MKLEAVLEKLAQYGIDHKPVQSGQPHHIELKTQTPPFRFTYRKYYNNNPEITEYDLHAIGVSLGLPKRWWEKDF